MNLIPIIISLLVTAVALFIVSKLPTGVEIDSAGKLIFSAVVFGILNASLHFILDPLTLPLRWLTFGLFSLVVNAFIFGLAAWLVTGFRLRWGILSAFIGSFAFAVINSIINHLLPITAN